MSCFLPWCRCCCFPVRAAQAQGLSREQAAQALSKPDTPMRRDAATRLGEVGTMADATLLVNALRDAAGCPDVAAGWQALWRIWARSGDQEVDKLYEMGVEQMNAGDFGHSIATFTRIRQSSNPILPKAGTERATLYFLVDGLRKSRCRLR